MASRSSRRTQRPQAPRRPDEPGAIAAGSTRRAGPYLPLACAAAILLLSALPAVLSNVGLRAALWGAAAFVVLGTASVFGSARAQGRVLEFEFVARRPHYLQAVLQAIIYAYWGYHFRLVYDQVPLMAAQLAFAYAFDMLLAWSHRDRYTLGFGQFPIIFSINLFIWFKQIGRAHV